MRCKLLLWDGQAYFDLTHAIQNPQSCNTSTRDRHYAQLCTSYSTGAQNVYRCYSRS